MSNQFRSYIEKSIGEITIKDRIVRVNAQVYKIDPFIIDDGSGKAHVRSSCAFKESDKVRVMGYVSFNESGNMLEIEPIAVQGMNEFDFDLYRKMQLFKDRLNDHRYRK